MVNKAYHNAGNPFGDRTKPYVAPKTYPSWYGKDWVATFPKKATLLQEFQTTPVIASDLF